MISLTDDLWKVENRHLKLRIGFQKGATKMAMTATNVAYIANVRAWLLCQRRHRPIGGNGRHARHRFVGDEAVAWICARILEPHCAKLAHETVFATVAHHINKMRPDRIMLGSFFE